MDWSGNQSLSESFSYDVLNRLTSYQVNASPAKTVSYDAIGNILSKSDVGTYSYPAAGQARPHAVAAITGTLNGVVNPSFAYDADGNMIASAGRSVSWTSFNMVAAIVQGAVSVTYGYDAGHARIKQVAPEGTTYYFDDAASGVSVEEFAGSGGALTWNEYLYANGAMVGERFNVMAPSGGVSLRYFVADHLGSIAVLTDAAGAVSERLSYDAWGKRRYPNGNDDTAGALSSQTTRGFTAQEHIPDVGLITSTPASTTPPWGGS